MRLVDGREQGRFGKGQAEDRLAGSPDDAADAEPGGGAEHVVGAHHVDAEGGLVGRRAGLGNTGEVEHGIEAARGGVDARKRAHNGTKVRAVKPDGVVAVDRADDIETGHAVSGGPQRGDRDLAQFAAAARDRDAHGLTAPWWR